MAKNDDWREAIKLCRLNQRTVAMAKELGMSPKSLIKNRPSKDQQWKAPVHVWVEDLYRKRFGDKEPGQPRFIENHSTQGSQETGEQRSSSQP